LTEAIRSAEASAIGGAASAADRSTKQRAKCGSYHRADDCTAGGAARYVLLRGE